MDMISADFLIVNGVSSDSLGLWIDTPPVPPMAQQRVTAWQTGTDMDETAPDDTWENITLNFSAYAFFRSSFDLSAVYAFLADAKTLEFSRFPGRYFKVRMLSGITPQAQYDGARIKIALQFICAPFKYHTENPELAPSGTVENPGTRYSRPIYKISHNGGCAVIVNGEVLTIVRGASSPIFVDATRMIAYSANGENQTKYTVGNFPFLQPGDNTISTTASDLTIIGNWRDY